MIARRLCSLAAFAALAAVPKAQIKWTRGKPSLFKSSSVAKRGFCKRIGPVRSTVQWWKWLAGSKP